MSIIIPKPPAPSPEEVLKDLAALIPAVYGAIEDGTQGAREYFEDLGAPVDPYLGSAIVRWRGKRYLDGTATVGSDVEYEREELSNNGLALHFRDGRSYAIRIRKADHGMLPVPGPSRTLRAFYRQEQLSFDYGINGHQPDDPLNLIFLWEVTDTYRLKGFRLVCPRDGELTRESVRWHWDVEVPHPALTVDGATSVEQPDDLDIGLDEPGENTGNSSA